VFPSPFPFAQPLFRGAGPEKMRGEQLKWSLVFRLYVGRINWLAKRKTVNVKTVYLRNMIFNDL